MIATTRSVVSVSEPVLFVAFELGKKDWKLAMTSGFGVAAVISIQLAWNWVYWQPHSARTRWYRERFGTGKRARRIGIVAVARKLLIALWQFVSTGVVPAGAVLKGA